MSIELGRNSINNLSIYELDEDPSQGSGLQAVVGSIALINADFSDMYFKFGPGDNDWQTFVKKSFFQAENTNVGQNLNADENPAYNTQVSIFGTIIESGIGDFTQVGESVQTNFDGFVVVSCILHLLVDNESRSILTRLKKNTIQIGPVASSGHVRNKDGNKESSLSIITIIPVAIGDIISLHSRREGKNGNVFLAEIGTSQILFERY